MEIVKIGNLSGNPRDRQIERVYSQQGVAPTLDSCGGGGRMPKVLTYASRQRGKKPSTYHKLEFGGEIANSITTINTDSMIAEEIINETDLNELIESQVQVNTECQQTLDEIINKVSVEFEGKRLAIRKLTEWECLRLMGVNEKRIQQAKQSGISKTQVYKMAGNSIVVHQLHAIFEQMFYPIPQRGEQLTLFQ